MARRIASGGQGDASGPDLVEELDTLAELLRRKNAELELSEGLLDVDARAIRLERFGLGRLGASIGDQDPPGSIPEGARHRVAALARLIARGVPFSPDPEAPGPPTGTVPDEPGGGGEPAVDPNSLVLVAEWARLVDLGLIASGVDPANRRETLRRFSIEQLSCECRRRGAPVPAEVSREADRLADRILAEGPGPPGPPTNPVNVPVPVTTTLVPTAPSMPAVNPAFVLGPAPRHCWACPRSW
jgi:hypothetical protein